MCVQDSFLLNLCHLQKSISMRLADPVLWSVKLTVRGALPEVGVAKKAVTGTI